ncbi:MAG: hypothetical protein MI974_09245 [Chitinophagales bacterium]|nr:hypothetical protein [Chitinophagales bacterium]
MKYLIFSTLLLCVALWSCEQDNFDETVSEEETFTPSVTELSSGKWAVGIDTIPIPIDSSWIGGVLGEDRGIIEGFNGTGAASISDLYIMEFSVPGGYPFTEGNYDLVKLIYTRKQYDNSTNTWNTVIDKEWAGDQIDGTVEITEIEEVYSYVYNMYVDGHTGFASGTLIDEDGTSHDFTSAFLHIY